MHAHLQLAGGCAELALQHGKEVSVPSKQHQRACRRSCGWERSLCKRLPQALGLACHLAGMCREGQHCWAPCMSCRRKCIHSEHHSNFQVFSRGQRRACASAATLASERLRSSRRSTSSSTKSAAVPHLHAHDWGSSRLQFCALAASHRAASMHACMHAAGVMRGGAPGSRLALSR
jgi:hypothetical protein